MVHILLWAVVGGLAGLIFGLTAGLSARMTVFVVLLGAGAAAVPLIEAEVRGKRKVIRDVKPSRVDAPPADAKATAGAAPRPHEVLSPDEARQWLDEFLLKQQEN